ncbi:MAG: hypothetical protein JSU63_12465 [Phycisphaerales bacterium]|nr:MAG: hypothetical protein JSU63_12465 [Phycisphaerales bacterium]
MKLRAEQMDVFSAHAESQFEKRVVSHLQTHFPDKCRKLGRGGVLESVKRGIARARAYDITTEYDVARFIDLTFRLSQDFDTSKETPWAGEILNDPDVPPWSRMDELWNRAESELDGTAAEAPDDESADE